MKKRKTIYFDLDGTIADLYGFAHWLYSIHNEDARPFLQALPLIDMELLIQLCIQLQKRGYQFGVITWLPKGATEHYKNKVRHAKRIWLKTYFPIEFKSVHMVQYGACKRYVNGSRGDILIDDDINNIRKWEGAKRDRVGVHCKDNHDIIIETLKRLLNE